METENKNLENKYVLFKLDNEDYGLNIDDVLSIEKIQSCTRVPNAPEYVVGVINLRGEVIPILDLRRKLNLEPKPGDQNSRIIITSSNDIVVGLIVDSSSEVLEIKDENIDNPSATGEKKFNEYIKGIGKDNKRLVIVLDLEKLLDIE
ncbi:MAG: chemotaxis protein CheW [Clostridiaceae bacterium]|nr:chemotaxis protein CheW [Clostridiaceae bacterium]MBW4858758.1 chemotaxis protein CheW [Clostridiaceae bacterium]MBW4868217.1 chemotaxis protein CheW [Clostridiaceae bacterium]